MAQRASDDTKAFCCNWPPWISLLNPQEERHSDSLPSGCGVSETVRTYTSASATTAYRYRQLFIATPVGAWHKPLFLFRRVGPNRRYVECLVPVTRTLSCIPIAAERPN